MLEPGRVFWILFCGFLFVFVSCGVAGDIERGLNKIAESNQSIARAIDRQTLNCR